MKYLKHLTLTVAAVATLAACGGGGDSTTTTSTASGLSDPAAVTTRYATGCVDRNSGDPGRLGYGWLKANIAITKSPVANAGTAEGDLTYYTDSGCTKQLSRAYVKGPFTLSGATRSLTRNAVTKIGQDGQLTIVDVTVAGLTLSGSPTGQVIKFTLVEEADRIYLGVNRGADGYPQMLPRMPAMKQ